MVWAASLDNNNGSSANALSSVTGRAALSLRSISVSNDPTACQMSECGNGQKSVTPPTYNHMARLIKNNTVAQTVLRLWSMATTRREMWPSPRMGVEPSPALVRINTVYTVVRRATSQHASGEEQLPFVGMQIASLGRSK